MTPNLSVIALISGGKDSLFSILHCQAHGHRIVALANLYPAVHESQKSDGKIEYGSSSSQATQDDLNSFMYQTVGHTVIPLYEEALGIPLYRQEISGSAVNEQVTYETADGHEDGVSRGDETESLIPLLRTVMRAHPEANAVSTGAILSDYQRTRVESVALRSHLIPLSYLWQYPSLPPGTATSLLDDMLAVGQDARLIKVASGGLDASHLWENVASPQTKRRLLTAMRLYGEGEGGAVLGEGGEFETLAIDGPSPLWKKRLEIRADQRVVVDGGSGSALLRITGAEAIAKTARPEGAQSEPEVRIPDLLEAKFSRLLEDLSLNSKALIGNLDGYTSGPVQCQQADQVWTSRCGISKWYISNMINVSAGDQVEAQISSITRHLQSMLSVRGKSAGDIVSTTIILRSMASFGKVNSVYATLFSKPNPPARVTIAVGDTLPAGAAVMMSVVVDLLPRHTRKSLHVQSRSYWAPANIGPYSQAISTRAFRSTTVDDASNGSVTYVAGQIPLAPATMEVVACPGRPEDPLDSFRMRSVLALQHLWRVGRVMNVSWWAAGTAYLTGDDDVESKAAVAWEAWKLANAAPDEPAEEEVDDNSDVWDRRYGTSLDDLGRSRQKQQHLPDFDVVTRHGPGSLAPAFCAVQVEDLPRGCDTEWAAAGLNFSRLHTRERKHGGSSLHAVSSSKTTPGIAVIHASLAGGCSDEQIDEWLSVHRDPEQLSAMLGLMEMKLSIEHITVYADRLISTLRLVDSYTLIPCRAIWGPEAKRLSVAMTIRCCSACECPENPDSST